MRRRIVTLTVRTFKSAVPSTANGKDHSEPVNEFRIDAELNRDQRGILTTESKQGAPE